MKAISYSLFGYNKERQDNCFDFNSYLRGLMINIRMNRLLFPDWKIILQTDKNTYEGWGSLFDRLPIELEVHQNNVPLTLAMLWRLRPIFDTDKVTGKWKYTHVMCRDLDSPATWKEAQAVKYWINKDKTAHAITDSESHDVPMLGGMIGFRPEYFTHRIGCQTWKELINKNPNFNWEVKGTDQTFLSNVVYPSVAQHGSDSITQHYFHGMPNSFLSDYRTCLCQKGKSHEPHCINNIELDLPIEYKESDGVCGHIGASGAYMSVLSKFLYKHKDKFEDLILIEKGYKDVFYWADNYCF